MKAVLSRKSRRVVNESEKEGGVEYNCENRRVGVSEFSLQIRALLCSFPTIMEKLQAKYAKLMTEIKVDTERPFPQSFQSNLEEFSIFILYVLQFSILM